MKYTRENLYLNSQNKVKINIEWVLSGVGRLKEYPVYEMKLTPQRPDEL